MAQLQPDQFTLEELNDILYMLKMTKVTVFVYTALLVIMIPNAICAIRMLISRTYRGVFTPVPWLCFLQSISAFLLLFFSLVGYFIPFGNCATQGRLIEAWFVIAMGSLHCLLFVKSYYALNKAKWLFCVHILLECGFVGSFIFATFQETFIRLELENTCLSILSEATLLAELVFDIVINVFYSGIFVIILRNQQLNANQAQWRALTHDGLIYMFGITGSTTILVVISILLGPENLGVMLFILAVVVGSCLMTSQLWNAKRRATSTNNSYLDSNTLKQFTASTADEPHISHQISNSLHGIKAIELDLDDFKVSGQVDDATQDHLHSGINSRPESILLRDKNRK